MHLHPRTTAYVAEMEAWHRVQYGRALAGEAVCTPFLEELGNFGAIGPSARLVFEPVKMAHAEEIVTHFAADPYPFTDPRFKEINYLVMYLADMELRLPFRKEGAGMDYVFRLHTGAFAGIVHLYHVDMVDYGVHKGVFSMGYLVAPNQRGQGLAGEAAHHLGLQLGMRFPHLHIARAFVDEHNLASRRVLNKLGFSLYAEAEEEGDELEYQRAVWKDGE